jgi:hypothetical protein
MAGLVYVAAFVPDEGESVPAIICGPRQPNEGSAIGITDTAPAAIATP